MNVRKKLMCRLPTTMPDKFVEVTIRYDAGGICYATYKNKPRGYYISVSPLTIKENMVSFSAFSGYTSLIEETPRFSAKRLDQLVTMMNGPEREAWQGMLEEVLSKNGLTLAVEEPSVAS